MQKPYAKRRINVRAIIYRDGKILAARHGHGDNMSHYYAVLGGGLDPREPLGDGLIRELREETNVEAKLGKLLFIQQFPSSREGYTEELEFFFEVKNPEDFIDINLKQTTHGAKEIAYLDFINPKQNVIYPKFLQEIDIERYIENDLPTLVVNNLNEHL